MEYFIAFGIVFLLVILRLFALNHASLTWLKQALAITEKWKLDRPLTVNDLKAYNRELAIFMDKRFWYKPFVPRRSITLVQNLMESIGLETIATIFKNSAMDAQEKQDEPN